MEGKLAENKMNIFETEGFFVKMDTLNGYTIDTSHQTFGYTRAGLEEKLVEHYPNGTLMVSRQYMDASKDT